MSMNISDKYLETLKAFTDWVTVSDWAVRVGEMYPDLLEKANKEAAAYKKPSTGQREIAARISSWVSSGGFGGLIEVDESERPRKVRYMSEEQQALLVEKEIEEDTEPLTRLQIIKRSTDELSTKDLYRYEEMRSISSLLNTFFRLDFEVDHAIAILNAETPGLHHPDNLQIIQKSHNRMKHSSNWQRFSIDEQIDYIRSVVRVQSIVAKKMDIDLDESVIESILVRLKMVF